MVKLVSDSPLVILSSFSDAQLSQVHNGRLTRNFQTTDDKQLIINHGHGQETSLEPFVFSSVLVTWYKKGSTSHHCFVGRHGKASVRPILRSQCLMTPKRATESQGEKHHTWGHGIHFFPHETLHFFDSSVYFFGAYTETVVYTYDFW